MLQSLRTLKANRKAPRKAGLEVENAALVSLARIFRPASPVILLDLELFAAFAEIAPKVFHELGFDRTFPLESSVANSGCLQFPGECPTPRGYETDCSLWIIFDRLTLSEACPLYLPSLPNW